jgi:hypothetical protein
MFKFIPVDTCCVYCHMGYSHHRTLIAERLFTQTLKAWQAVGLPCGFFLANHNVLLYERQSFPKYPLTGAPRTCMDYMSLSLGELASYSTPLSLWSSRTLKSIAPTRIVRLHKWHHSLTARFKTTTTHRLSSTLDIELDLRSSKGVQGCM